METGDQRGWKYRRLPRLDQALPLPSGGRWASNLTHREDANTHPHAPTPIPPHGIVLNAERGENA